MFDAKTPSCPKAAVEMMPLPHAPADHPAIAKEKVGVLLANLGTPDHYDYWSMRRYLNEFLSDRRVIDYSPWLWQPLLQLIILTKRPFTSGRNYKSIWNTEADESPLMTITKAQTAKIAAVMQERHGDNVVVDFCMRYGNPSTPDRLRALIEQGCRKIVFFPLYPQYAGATTATANDQFFRALMAEKWQPPVRTVPAYSDHPVYIDALAKSVERAWEQMAEKPDVLVASYHGMPKRYLLEGDPYHCHCAKTARLLRDLLGMDDTQLKLTFQSRFGPTQWLQPYTDKTVVEMAEAGTKKIAVVTPGFISDCVETLEEIGIELQGDFKEAGGTHFTTVPCLNETQPSVDLLNTLALRDLSGWL